MLELLSSIEGVPYISQRGLSVSWRAGHATAGNAISYIELGVKCELADSIVDTAISTCAPRHLRTTPAWLSERPPALP
jgi:hypothetical protein